MAGRVWKVWEIDPDSGMTIETREAGSKEEAELTAGLMKGTLVIIDPDGNRTQFNPPQSRIVDEIEWT